MSTGLSPAEQLRTYFSEVAPTPQMAGATVLRKLSDLASASIVGKSDAQDAVGFALSEVLSRHSEDLEDRQVTGDDAYRLMAAGGELLSEAVTFIEKGGSDKDATRLVSGLAHLTPDRLNNRWPPASA